jgi:hypothetical protein
MKLTSNDKEVLAGFVLMLFGVYFIWTSAMIKGEEEFFESAGIFPLIVSGIFTLLSAIHMCVSLFKGGHPTVDKISISIRLMLKNEGFREVMLAIGIVALYIFVGATFVSIYLAGAILIFGILRGFVRRIRLVVSLAVTCGLVAAMYLVFTVMFKMPII